MKYDITKNKAPEMPNLGKGTECIKLLLSQASKDMHEPLVPMLFPSLGAHISCAEFQYPDRSWKEMCGLMAQLVGDSGCNKGQLTDLVKAICRDFQQHDDQEFKKLEEWAKLYHSKSKDKPVKPAIAIFFPPSDTTNVHNGDGSLCVLLHKENRPRHARLMRVDLKGILNGIG